MAAFEMRPWRRRPECAAWPTFIFGSFAKGKVAYCDAMTTVPQSRFRHAEFFTKH